jgi:hypothetical protein
MEKCEWIGQSILEADQLLKRGQSLSYSTPFSVQDQFQFLTMRSECLQKIQNITQTLPAENWKRDRVRGPASYFSNKQWDISVADGSPQITVWKK